MRLIKWLLELDLAASLVDLQIPDDLHVGVPVLLVPFLEFVVAVAQSFRLNQGAQGALFAVQGILMFIFNLIRYYDVDFLFVHVSRREVGTEAVAAAVD